MANPSSMLRKTLVIGILILFIGISVVSSTIGIAEDKSSNNNFLESTNNPKDGLYCNHSAYIIGDGPDCYLYEFILNNPSDLNCVCEGSIGDFSHATWSSDNYIYCVEYDSSLLIVIDIDTCEMWSIGGGGQSLNALAYDPLTQNMYGVGATGVPGQDYLVKIDPVTGEQEEIGKLGGQIYYTVGIAFDSEGILYGWDIGTSSLFTIDIETGEATQVGPLGINIYYACDGDFCKKDDILYIVHDNILYKFDKDTGECELNNQFPDYVSVTGLAIPYWFNDTTPPVTTYTLDPPEPDGCNGWYISNVTVTLKAEDDTSVNATYYRINGGEWETYDSPFIISEDGEDILIEYYSVDNAGNIEDVKSATLDIDRTPPEITVEWGVQREGWREWWVTFYINITDNTSGVCDRIEIYLNDVLQEVLPLPGPIYHWSYQLSGGLSLTFKFVSCDNACNQVIVLVNSSDIKSRPRIESSGYQHSIHLWFLRLFERFPILEVFLRAMNLLRYV